MHRINIVTTDQWLMTHKLCGTKWKYTVGYYDPNFKGVNQWWVYENKHRIYIITQNNSPRPIKLPMHSAAVDFDNIELLNGLVTSRNLSTNELVNMRKHEKHYH